MTINLATRCCEAVKANDEFQEKYGSSHAWLINFPYANLYMIEEKFS